MNKLKYFFIFLLFFTLLFSATQTNAQTDSTSNHDELISAENMEAPGIIALLNVADSSFNVRYGYDPMQEYEGNPRDKIIIWKEKESMNMYFDPKTLAMKVEFDKSKKQKPIYFFNDIVYSPINKNEYVKVPTKLLSKMFKGRSMLNAFIDPKGFVNITIEEAPVTYYGMDVNPKTYPILEWAFVYKPKYFEIPDFKKDIIQKKEGSPLTKYTATSGKDAGAFVLFDSKNRLILIQNTKKDFISYSYEKVNVELPKNAKELYNF